MATIQRKRQQCQTAAEFWEWVDRGAPEECWEWQRSKFKTGYGAVRFGGKTRIAHRVAYEFAHGPIPDGLHIDHKCRNRACVNPEHLEAVTQAENNRREAEALRKPECRHGHLWTPENTIYMRDGDKLCRECNRINCKARYAKRKLALTNDTHEHQR